MTFHVLCKGQLFNSLLVMLCRLFGIAKQALWHTERKDRSPLQQPPCSPGDVGALSACSSQTPLPRLAFSEWVLSPLDFGHTEDKHPQFTRKPLTAVWCAPQEPRDGRRSIPQLGLICMAGKGAFSSRDDSSWASSFGKLFVLGGPSFVSAFLRTENHRHHC